MSLYVVGHRVISVDAFQVMTIVPYLESAFPTFGSVTQGMIVKQVTVTNHATQLKPGAKIARLSLINVQQTKAKCFWCKIRIKTIPLATWTIRPSIIWAHQSNGSAFHLCVENVWERSFNVKTDTSSTIFSIAIQRTNVKMGVMNNSKTLVSDVQESQERPRVIYLRKIFTIRRLSAQMVQIYVS